MEENVIKLKKDNILRLKIQTHDGKDTGEVLEFDLEDAELFLRYQDMIEEDKKSRSKLKNELYLISKRQDNKGKKLLSKNEEDTIRTINNFFNKEKEIYNMFLGENGVEKLLNGRKMGWNTLDEVDDIIIKQIAPYFERMMDNFTKKMKEKYANISSTKEVLKNE